MIYFIFGANSYRAAKKLREFREAFFKKTSLTGVPAGEFLVEEFDGETEDLSAGSLNLALEQGSLFVKNRLVLFKNVLRRTPELLEILKEKADILKKSKDILVFWERDPEAKVLAYFKKNSEKTQEMAALSAGELNKWLNKKAQELGLTLGTAEKEAMMEEADPNGANASPEWALENALEKLILGAPAGKKSDFFGDLKPDFKKAGASSPFPFVGKIFSAYGEGRLLTFKKAAEAGHIPEKIIYPLLWKAKQRHMLDAYKKGILAESAMRRDSKNAYEHLERFILALRAWI